MSSQDLIALAASLFQQGFEAQRRGALREAEALYRRSIEAFPTAEAHTFLGWAYSAEGRLDEAIEECQRAIAVDPDFGNPYNDIGAYLIDLGRPGEAILWLERASRARRYEPRHYPHFNLGRAYLALQMPARALEAFEAALEIAPEFAAAREAAASLRRALN